MSADGDAVNSAATPIPLYLCPADPSLDGNLNSTGYASTSYVANLMVFDPRNPGNLMTAMRDGVSNTVMFVERYKDCQGYQPAWANHPACPGGRNNTPVFGWTDLGFPGNPSFSNGTQGFQIAPAIADCDPRITQGNHPRAMEVLLGDGSVRGVSSKFSNREWLRLCNPDDGPEPGYWYDNARWME